MADHYKLHAFSSFSQIDSSASEIRLLGLQPGDADSPIHCSYHIASLNDKTAPSYETLSYAWHNVSGENEPLTHTIHIDSHPAEVSHTLFHAMQRLRLVDRVRYVWIDAISINQADPLEKTQQVNLMRRIYSRCSQCVIWLGSLGEVRAEDAQASMDMLAWIAAGEGEQDSRPPPSWLSDPPARCRAASALKTLITSPWWGRIWTVQEAILPPQATLIWGPCQICWSLMHRAAQNMVEGAFLDPPAEFDESLDHVCAAMSGLRYSVHEPLLHLLWRWRFRRASDPRDKVYALVGIQEYDDEACIRPDYTLGVVTVFSWVTAELIRVGGCLEALVGRRGEASEFEEMPTWAVDWMGRLDGTGVAQFWAHSQRYHHLGYTADRGTYGVGDGLRMADERTLILSGVFVDRVAVVERPDHPVGGDADHWVEHAERWGELISNYHAWLATNEAGKKPDSSWMRAFLGLMTGKLIPEEPDHGDPPEDWLREMLLPQRAFITEQGHFGVGPLSLKPGQEVWVVGGCRFPVILDSRKCIASEDQSERETKFNFTFVGDCFVHGIMRGEAVGGREQVDIRLH